MTRNDLQAALLDLNARAFLMLIRTGEGTADVGGYTRLYGGKQFTSLADHPRILVHAGGLSSTAAGAYQFLSKTWDGLVKQYGFTDFSRQSQDEGAVALIAGRNALEDVITGQIESAIRKCNKEWASLPESPYGQPTLSMAKALKVYAQYGGKLAQQETQAPAPVEERSTQASQEDINRYNQEKTIMNPFVLAAIPQLLQYVPDLIRTFGTAGTEITERNAKAAEMVVEVAKQVTNQPTAEGAVQAVQEDPAAQAALREQVYQKRTEMFGLIEQSVAEARIFNKEEPPIVTKFGSFRFIHLLSLLAVVCSYVGGFFVLSSDLSGELKAAIVTLMLIGGFTSVMTFWYGSSNGSAVKGDSQANLLDKLAGK